ncbi:uncharacterized protein LOC116414993 [Apis florea]|uniref:uncharacterized protein LOC116414993 n=1 Tax=Apis florea TaxID=7463 RepID=UPI0012FF46CD|nr:uncharacterized protein LOC116414993 [Apis florea]
MDNQRKHLRHIMLQCFKKGNSANDTVDEICTVYRNGATIIMTIRNWFKRFRANNFDLKNEDRSGCPIITKNIEFIKQHEKDSFLKRLVSEDKTWILYQCASKTHLTIDFQLETINSAQNCDQLNKLKAAIAEKQPLANQ